MHARSWKLSHSDGLISPGSLTAPMYFETAAIFMATPVYLLFECSRRSLTFRSVPKHEYQTGITHFFWDRSLGFPFCAIWRDFLLHAGSNFIAEAFMRGVVVEASATRIPKWLNEWSYGRKPLRIRHHQNCSPKGKREALQINAPDYN